MEPWTLIIYVCGVYLYRKGTFETLRIKLSVSTWQVIEIFCIIVFLFSMIKSTYNYAGRGANRIIEAFKNNDKETVNKEYVSVVLSRAWAKK